ncbi:MAG: hypothetical protein JW834_01520 [Candidatus Diapherotrites archaeon]|nr:hypothetical protein [Candidatus Diapherotrites archaeon]
MGVKGFYLTVDVTLAISLALVVLMALSYSVMSQIAPRSGDLIDYKYTESIAYSLKNSGAIENAVNYMDLGNVDAAETEVRAAIGRLGVKGKYHATINTYNAAGDQNYSIDVANGRVSEKSITVNVAFRTNSTNPFGFLRMRWGG